jgi:hypothetical protein
VGREGGGDEADGRCDCGEGAQDGVDVQGGSPEKRSEATS